MKTGLRVSFSKPEKPGEHPFEPALRFASKLGLDGVELCLDPIPPYGPEHGAWSEGIGKEERKRIRELCGSYGVEVATLCSEWPWGYSQYCKDFKHWARGLEILAEDMKLAADLGGKVLLVHFGASRASSWEEMKGVLRGLAREAESLGVVLGYEGGIWKNLGLGGLGELCRMVDEVGSPSFGVYEHCYWPRGEMRPHEEIELVGKRIVGLHSGRIDPRNVDYAAMFGALKKYYDRYWIFEIDEMEEVEENLKLLKELMLRYR
ncbi:MAG: sugar phosphate isomerase/epimerase [Candidatus Brockarchaeota archaeon]|nr:sugar phosphate isomerase/epimerase [Candidatus Brockarchaeota archaeon]